MNANSFRAARRKFSIIFYSVLAISMLGSRAANEDLPITVKRPLRYHPEGTDFVIDNGQHWFNRPLYGPHTAFHIDGGDKPEFVFINTTVKDGVLRFALVNGGSQKWLTDAAQITTRYRPGSLIYQIHDPLLGEESLRLTAI